MYKCHKMAVFFSSITRLYEQKHDKTSNSVSWVYLTSTISVNYHPLFMSENFTFNSRIIYKYWTIGEIKYCLMYV